MSNQPALSCPMDAQIRPVSAPIDLCERIYRRNYLEHQQQQLAISLDWTQLLNQG